MLCVSGAALRRFRPEVCGACSYVPFPMFLLDLECTGAGIMLVRADCKKRVDDARLRTPLKCKEFPAAGFCFSYRPPDIHAVNWSTSLLLGREFQGKATIISNKSLQPCQNPRLFRFSSAMLNLSELVGGQAGKREVHESGVSAPGGRLLFEPYHTERQAECWFA